MKLMRQLRELKKQIAPIAIFVEAMSKNPSFYLEMKELFEKEGLQDVFAELTADFKDVPILIKVYEHVSDPDEFYLEAADLKVVLGLLHTNTNPDSLRVEEGFIYKVKAAPSLSTFTAVPCGPKNVFLNKPDPYPILGAAFTIFEMIAVEFISTKLKINLVTWQQLMDQQRLVREFPPKD